VIFTTQVCYWKDGVRTDLECDSREQTLECFIAVDGNSVAIVSDYGFYWKDGIKYYLEILGALTCVFSIDAIALDGTDVYITGSTYDFDPNVGDPIKDVYWKNGKINDLPTLPSSRMNWTPALTITNGKIYAAGGVNLEDCHKTCFWEDWIPQPLSDLPNSILKASINTAIVIDGSDVYITDIFRITNNNIDYPAFAYWKNGVPTVLGSLDPAGSSSLVLRLSGIRDVCIVVK